MTTFATREREKYLSLDSHAWNGFLSWRSAKQSNGSVVLIRGIRAENSIINGKEQLKNEIRKLNRHRLNQNRRRLLRENACPEQTAGHGKIDHVPCVC